MAYTQKNNPFPVTSCGRRRTFTQGDNPGNDRTKESPYKQETSHEKNAGMTAEERKAYNNKTGGNVKGSQPEGGPRKDSYCARSAGIKKCKDPDKHGKCKNDYAREDWKC